MAVRGGDDEVTNRLCGFVRKGQIVCRKVLSENPRASKASLRGFDKNARIAFLHNRRERKRAEVARGAERRRREVNPIPSSIFPLAFFI